jgi:hypothetical protein
MPGDLVTEELRYQAHFRIDGASRRSAGVEGDGLASVEILRPGG